MTPARAKLASQTLQDVFTPDGDAGVIDRLYTFSNQSSPFYGKGQCAFVTGRFVNGWFPVVDLIERADLVCSHLWVAGMMVVDAEDLDVIARERATIGQTVECERCDVTYIPNLTL